MHSHDSTKPHEHVEISPVWLVRGRIIPASVTGSENLLGLQIKHIKWLESHYHTAQCILPPETAVEVAVAICEPYDRRLITNSLNADERTNNIQYIHMVHCINPANTLGFMTVTGVTGFIHFEDLDRLFQPQDCCSVGQPRLPEETSSLFQALLESSTGTETNH